MGTRLRPSVFIGSTTERISVAEAVEVNLSRVADLSSWKHAFRVGQPAFSELMGLKDRFDFAVIVLTADDLTNSRGTDFLSPRDNVVFELGLFLGSIGPDRVFAIIDETVPTKIMTDYLGVTFITYNSCRSDGDLNQALSPACVTIKQAMERHGPREQSSATPQFLIPGGSFGLENLYESMAVAEHALLADLEKDKGPIRLFFHIASQNIGLKGNLFEVIDRIAQSGGVDLRILHASLQSPLFSKDRLAALNKRPERVLKSLKHVDDSLRELETLAASTLRRRTHEQPFLWRIYGLSDRLYFMPYFGQSNAHLTSPALVFRRGDNSLFKTFVDWFDYEWERSAPQRVHISDMISSATPSGAAVIALWEDKHVFGIPKRDLHSGVARFYGLGGKRADRGERFVDCALREGNEESEGAVEEILSSAVTDYFRSDGSIGSITIAGEKIVPRLIFEKRTHTGTGSMKKDDDSYFLVAFDAKLKKRPLPSRELGAILLVPDDALKEFSGRSLVSVGSLKAAGAEIDLQPGISISNDLLLTPHGTASYLIRMIN